MNRRHVQPIAAIVAGFALSLFPGVRALSAETTPAPAQIDTRDALAAGSVPLQVPDAEKNRRSPTPASEAAVKAGGSLYSSQCLMCHGSDGAGAGPLAVRLRFTMPDLSAASYQKSRTDGEIFYVLSVGHGHMKGNEERLSEEARWNLVHYLRSLGSTR